MGKLKYTYQDLETYAFLKKNENNPKVIIPAKDFSDYDMSLMVLSYYFPMSEINIARETLRRGRVNMWIFINNCDRKNASKYISNKSVRMEVFDMHGNKCLKCGAYEDICLDHIVAVANGGGNDIDNLQPLCRSCNSSKGTKTIDYRISTH